MLERSKQGWYIDLNVTAWLAGWLGRAALSAPAQQVEAAQSFKNKVIEALDLGPVNNRITFSDNYLVGLIAELEKEDDSEAAQAPGKQDRIDAERYRWLRGRPIKQMVDEHGIQFTFALAEPEPNRWRVHSKRGEEMDAAIDAARAAQEKA